tara:strand:- start:632 stop:1120 length:489 start_codon:yes stop_codon:yes gene_type:complete
MSYELANLLPPKPAGFFPIRPFNTLVPSIFDRDLTALIAEFTWASTPNYILETDLAVAVLEWWENVSQEEVDRDDIIQAMCDWHGSTIEFENLVITVFECEITNLNTRKLMSRVIWSKIDLTFDSIIECFLSYNIDDDFLYFLIDRNPESGCQEIDLDGDDL